MRDFDHLILTRYSAVFSTDQEPAAEDWLWYRLGFFVEACVASVAGQTTRDFRWLVFIDDRCSDEFRSELTGLSEGIFEPIWTHRVFGSDLLSDEATARSQAPYLITTRLDSDDAIARDFVGSVHGEFARQERLFVNFTRGLQIDRSGAVYRRDQRSNPFVSLIEERRVLERPLTVFGSPVHADVRNDGPIREVKADPMWIQVVHGGNVANEIYGVRVRPGVVSDRFDIELGYRTEVNVGRLVRERVAGSSRVWATRASDRAIARQWLGSRLDRLRGSHTKPQRRP